MIGFLDVGGAFKGRQLDGDGEPLFQSDPLFQKL